jgi:DNA helicase HerA-like ATPase
MVNEVAWKGDYLLIEEDSSNNENKRRRSMVVQIYDEEYLTSQSLVEDIVREQVVNSSSAENRHDPLNIGHLARLIRDARIFKAKIRASIIDGVLSREITWLPSRVSSKASRLSIKELQKLLQKDGVYPISLGKSSGELFEIYAEDLDGSLSIITGKKESGKSHLSKLLVKTLVQHGATVIVFDLNDEYRGLGWNKDGSPSEVNKLIHSLVPGKELRFSLEYCGKFAVSAMMRNSLDVPPASMREFLRIWDWLEKKGSLGIDAIVNAVTSWNINELVRDALVSRCHVMQSSRLFCDDSGFEFEHASNGFGAAFVVNMAGLSSTVRKMVVELVLSKVAELLERKIIAPVFLFAEEAHLYIRDTYWEDIITRMRHFGMYTTFVTNQPDAINDGVYRQVDNIFLFNFTNDTDLDRIAKVSLADSDTIRSIVRTLPQKQCLVIGKAVRDLPIVVNIAPVDVLMMGETKRFFQARSS